MSDPTVGPVLPEDPIEREKAILQIATRSAAQASAVTDLRSAVGDLSDEVRALIAVVEEKNRHVEQLTAQVTALRADLSEFQTSEQVADAVAGMEGREKVRRILSIIAVVTLLLGLGVVQRLDERNNCLSRNKLRVSIALILDAAGVNDSGSNVPPEQAKRRQEFLEKITPILSPEHCGIL